MKNNTNNIKKFTEYFNENINIITKEDYLKVKKIVDEYELQLKNSNDTNKVIIRDDVPVDFWYSNYKGKQFNVRNSSKTDLSDVTDFGIFQPDECWTVIDGEFKGNVILKEHCI